MGIFLTSLILVTISIFINVFIWRVKVPSNHSLTIGLIYLIFFIPVYKINSTLYFNIKFVSDFIQIFIFHFLFLFAFLIAYTSIEKDSPSVILTLNIYNHGQDGLGIEKIYNFITDKEFIEPRIKDLIYSGLIKKENNKFYITKKGKISLFSISIFQKLVNQKQKSA